MDIVEKALIHLLQNGGTFFAEFFIRARRVEGQLPPNALMAMGVGNGRLYLFTNCKLLEEKQFTMLQVSNVLQHEALHWYLEHGTRREGRDADLWNIAADLAINSIIPGMDIGLIPGQGEFVDVPKGLTAEEYYNMPKVKSLGQGMKPEDIPNCSGARNETSDFDKEVVKKLAKDAKEAHEKAHGSLPGHVQKILDEFLKPPSINWKVVLRQFVAATIKAGTKKTWRKENRRKLPLKGSLKERKAKIVLALDTSGSIFGTPELLEEFWAEILGIRKAYNADITVVECDAEIQSVYTLKQSMKPVQPSGGGGTSFVPVYAYIAEKRMKVDVLIYLTDLYGCFPEKEYVRTLWVVCEGGANEVPFGKMIKIERRK